MSEKPAKPAASKPHQFAQAHHEAPQARSGRDLQARLFIHLEAGGSDQLGNWLRAERELMTA
jgi:hypothetical protein